MEDEGQRLGLRLCPFGIHAPILLLLFLRVCLVRERVECHF